MNENLITFAISNPYNTIVEILEITKISSVLFKYLFVLIQNSLSSLSFASNILILVLYGIKIKKPNKLIKPVKMSL